jgi:hypothetical protein
MCVCVLITFIILKSDQEDKGIMKKITTSIIFADEYVFVDGNSHRNYLMCIFNIYKKFFWSFYDHHDLYTLLLFI